MYIALSNLGAPVIQIFMSSAAWDILKLGGREWNFPYHCQVMHIISISGRIQDM